MTLWLWMSGKRNVSVCIGHELANALYRLPFPCLRVSLVVHCASTLTNISFIIKVESFNIMHQMPARKVWATLILNLNWVIEISRFKKKQSEIFFHWPLPKQNTQANSVRGQSPWSYFSVQENPTWQCLAGDFADNIPLCYSTLCSGFNSLLKT